MQAESVDKPEVEYVGFWVRVGAAVIDSFWLLPVIIGIIWWAYGAGYLDGIEGRVFAGTADFFAQMVFPALASIVFWLIRGATPGKMLFGAEIVDTKTLGKITPVQAVLRYIGYYVSIIPFFLGIFWVAFDARKQGWHDKIAGTLVIRAKNKS